MNDNIKAVRAASMVFGIPCDEAGTLFKKLDALDDSFSAARKAFMRLVNDEPNLNKKFGLYICAVSMVLDFYMDENLQALAMSEIVRRKANVEGRAKDLELFEKIRMGD